MYPAPFTTRTDTGRFSFNRWGFQADTAGPLDPSCWPVVLIAVLSVWAFRHELEDALARAGLARRERRS